MCLAIVLAAMACGCGDRERVSPCVDAQHRVWIRSQGGWREVTGPELTEVLAGEVVHEGDR